MSALHKLLIAISPASVEANEQDELLIRELANLQYLQVAIQVGHNISHALRSMNDQHSSSSCKGTSGLLHIMGSNTIEFCFFEAVTYNVALTLWYKHYCEKFLYLSLIHI